MEKRDIIIEKTNLGKNKIFKSTLEENSSIDQGERTSQFIGFGANEYESLESLAEQLTNHIKNLKRIHDEIESAKNEF